MLSSDRRRLISGVSLIALGIVLFILQRVEGIGASAVFFLVGGAFLAAYLYRREFGFLIPACILLGLGFGAVAGQFMTGGTPQLLGLGVGFVAIWAVALVYQRQNQWWPLIPGGVLILFSLPDSARILELVLDNWPLLLVAIGALILVRGFFGGSGTSRPA